MRIASLVVENFLRYRGEHVLELAPAVYAVVAQREHDPTSSNWAGKTSVLEAIAFALYGWHRHRTEDAWITDGEERGQVMLVLESGQTITRSRERGKPTQLSVETGGGALAHQKDAQLVIDELVGLSERDFFVTCFFRQKEMHRLVTMRPGDRQAVVDEWLALGPVVAAQADAKKRLLAACEREEKARTKAQALAEQRALIIAGSGAEDVAELAALVGKYERDVQEARSRADAVRGQVEAAAQRKRDVEAAEKLAELEERLGALDGAPAPSSDELADAERVFQQASEQLGVAQSQARERLALARGGFDGKCPVLPGFECPARAEITAQKQQAADAYDQADATLKQVQKQTDDARTVRADLQHQQRWATERAAERRHLERLIDELRPAAARAAQGSDIEIDEWALSRATEAEAMLARAKQDLERVGQLDQQIEGLAVQADAEKATATTAREAALLLGAARRRIAEQAVAEIEHGANSLLASAGIALEVRMRWERATQGLASACEVCGAAFPSSRKIRQCGRCGAARGPKLEEKLEVELSDRSGAADDLAGIALALSASAWLRAARGARWSVCCLDEPFGALDAANRQALGAHVASMLRRMFDQAFVVAHQQDVIEQLPARLLVTAGHDGSRIEVV